MTIDTVTMLAALGIISFGFSGAMFLIWRFLLPQKPLATWSMSLGIIGCGAFLVALRGQIPDLLSILAGNLALIGGCGLTWIGTCHYRGVKPHHRIVVLSLLLATPVYAWITWIEPNIAARIILCRALIIVYMVAAVATLLQNGSQRLTLMEKATIAGLLVNAFLPLAGIVAQIAARSYLEPLQRNAIIGLNTASGLIGITAWSLAAIMMILEKVVAEKEKTEEIFNQFMRYTPVFTYIKKISGNESIALHISDNFRQMLGLAPEEIIGKPMRALFPAELAEQITADDLLVAQSSTGLEREESLNGRIYSTIKFPILRNGTHSIIAGFTIDITERKQAEAEKVKLESQYRQLQKVESLGRMAGAIAHKFNNLLSVVMGNLEMAMLRLPPDAKPLDNLKEALKAAGRAAEVSGLMLTYLGQNPGRQEPLDLAGACDKMLPMIRAAIPQEAVLVTDLPAAGPVIWANEHQLQQLLTNLTTNAWEAFGNGRGVIRLAVTTIAAPKIPATHCFPLDWQPEATDYACLEISDDGCGIAATDIDKLCDPFFTTKFTGRGLGLAVALGIVRSHQGAITIASETGNGSTIRVFFPIASGELPHQPEQTATEPASVACGTVLLVEDEQLVRRTTAVMLGHLGFAVLEASDGCEALELFNQHRDTIRCILSDLTMPRMDGWETLTALRRLAPGIPVILSSGYDQTQVMAGDHPEWPQVFLGKPYRLADLDDALRQALGGERPP